MDLSNYVPKQVKDGIISVNKNISHQKHKLNKKYQKEEDQNTRDENQIAGHNIDELGRRRLFFENGKVYKLCDSSDPRGTNEIKLYELLNKYSPEIMGRVVPRYYGTKEIRDGNAGGEPGSYVVMENIFKSLNNGEGLCMADVKVGELPKKQKFSDEKVNNLVFAAKNRVIEKYGFQVLGMKVKDSRTGNDVNYGLLFGRSAKIFGVEYIVSQFLLGCQLDSNYRAHVITDLMNDLKAIENWLSYQTNYRFMGSSLILAYIPENKHSKTQIQPEKMYQRHKQSNLPNFVEIPFAGCIKQDPKNSISSSSVCPYPVFNHFGKTVQTPTKKAVARLIDFNNWIDSEGVIDELTLKGVQGLMEYLRNLL